LIERNSHSKRQEGNLKLREDNRDGDVVKEVLEDYCCLPLR
jgi:hypothetical protein